LKNENITKKIRIKSFILEEREADEEINIEEFEEVKMSATEEEEERVEIRNVPHLRIERDTRIVEMNVNAEDFEKLGYVFKLYGIPTKPIEDGIEIDIREREPYPYREKPPPNDV